MSLFTIERMLIAIARGLYGDISPCARRDSLMACFDVQFGRLYLYFNTADNSTRVVSADITTIPTGNILIGKGI